MALASRSAVFAGVVLVVVGTVAGVAIGSSLQLTRFHQQSTVISIEFANVTGLALRGYGETVIGNDSSGVQRSQTVNLTAGNTTVCATLPGCHAGNASVVAEFEFTAAFPLSGVAFDLYPATTPSSSSQRALFFTSLASPASGGLFIEYDLGFTASFSHLTIVVTNCNAVTAGVCIV